MCVSYYFYPLGTDLTNSYIPGLYRPFCFCLKNHKSEINPAQPQNCYCYDGIYEFIDLCHCQNYYRAIPVINQSHLWPELPIFPTDALIHFSQHLLQWYLISSPTLSIHQSTQSMNSLHTSIHSMCDLIFDHDPVHWYIQYKEVPIILAFHVILWTH